MRIIAYTYEADDHCITCTVKRYKNSICIDYLRGTPCRNCRDSNGVLYEQLDREGNLVNPLFSTDEWQEFDESFLAENPIQYLACGDCHEVIEEYHHGAL